MLLPWLCARAVDLRRTSLTAETIAPAMAPGFRAVLLLQLRSCSCLLLVGVRLLSRGAKLSATSGRCKRSAPPPCSAAVAVPTRPCSRGSLCAVESRPCRVSRTRIQLQPQECV